MSDLPASRHSFVDPAELCARVEAGLAAAQASDDPLKILAGVIGDLRRLRKLFRSRRTELADLEPRLKAIGAGLDQLTHQLAGSLADCWVDIEQELHDLQNEREACRELLLRLVKQQQVDRLAASSGDLSLQLASRLELPPSNSHARRELETLLRGSPVWAAISELRPLQLMRMWKQGGLHPHLAHRVASLCRLVETLVVRTQWLNAAPSSGLTTSGTPSGDFAGGTPSDDFDLADAEADHDVVPTAADDA